MNANHLIEKFQALVERDGDTLGRLLFQAERLVLETTNARLQKQTGTRLSVAQMQLIQQICLGSIRTTDLAERMGMTKQAVGQLVDHLEDKGLVKRMADPADRRVKNITYTPTGFTLVSALIDITVQVEQDIARATGLYDLRSLKRNLMAVAGAELVDQPAAVE